MAQICCTLVSFDSGFGGGGGGVGVVVAVTLLAVMFQALVLERWFKFFGQS